jgi:Uma2 family endonuclease
MTMLVEDNPTAETIADLLHDLGDVPPERVRMKPPPGTATEQHVLDLDDHDDRLCELVDGVLVEKAMSSSESLLALVIGSILHQFVRAQKLGRMLGADGMLQLGPRLIRMPDVSFISKDRFPGGKLPNDAIWQIAPDLAVEVLSKSNTRREMARKRSEYFAAGTRLVWEFDPKTRSVAVYTGPEQFTTLKENQILDGGAVLPGLSISLSELFAQLDDLPPALQSD